MSATATPDEHVPDAIEPIVAYRLWSADAELRLTSLNSRTIWPVDAWTVAECEQHRAPDEHCTCGLYAVKEELLEALDLARFVPTGPAAARPLVWPAPIVGKVKLAGKVIEHEHGYRAERARLVQVFPRPSTRRESTLVAGRYGVRLGPELPEGSELLAGGWTTPWRFADFVRTTMVILVLVGMGLLAVIVRRPLTVALVMFVDGWNAIFDRDLHWSDWYFYVTVALGGLVGLVSERFLYSARGMPRGRRSANKAFPQPGPNQDSQPAATTVRSQVPDRPRPY